MKSCYELLVGNSFMVFEKSNERQKVHFNSFKITLGC